MSLKSEALRFFSDTQKSAKRSLGQNFLVDPNLTTKLVDLVLADSPTHVLEIGPGLGALTQKLLQRGSVTIVAVEKDQRLAQRLKDINAGTNALQVIEADFLEVDLMRLSLGEKTIVLGNLPYNVSVPITNRITQNRTRFRTAYLMFQKEVANRIQARPNSKAYGSLSVALQMYAEIKKVTDVSPQCFFPEPKVDSTVLAFDFLADARYELPAPDFFEQTLRIAFQTRRKTLRNCLKKHYSAAELAAAEKAFDLNRRAESFELEELARLACVLWLTNAER